VLKELSEHFYFQSTSSHSFYDGSGETPGSSDLQFFVKNSKVYCLSDLEAFCLQADTMFHGILENDVSYGSIVGEVALVNILVLLGDLVL